MRFDPSAVIETCAANVWDRDVRSIDCRRVISTTASLQSQVNARVSMMWHSVLFTM